MIWLFGVNFVKMTEKQRFDWSDLADTQAFIMWGTDKLDGAKRSLERAPVTIGKLGCPDAGSIAEVVERCRKDNWAVYESSESESDSELVRTGLRGFASAFGLQIAEAHRSAGDHGIVELRQTDEQRQRGYIPYSNRAMNWHTDGYYNGPADHISSFVLHNVQQASSGGVNQLIDPEIVYIRLRQSNPAFVAALMHREAMVIPENREPDGSIRPVSVGPVFFADPATGRLQMRYTARTRSIEWRDDPATGEAVDFLRELLASEPLTCTIRLKPGQGILNNNVLHNRTEFEDDKDSGTRIVYRVRFHNRVGGV